MDFHNRTNGRKDLCVPQGGRKREAEQKLETRTTQQAERFDFDFDFDVHGVCF
jgi:hypothetical protein